MLKSRTLRPRFSNLETRSYAKVARVFPPRTKLEAAGNATAAKWSCPRTGLRAEVPRIGMSDRRQKLELTWIGKENRPRLEPRILIEDPDRSHHAPHRVSDNDQFDNRLIFGDNLLALKALEQEFTGKIKCIFIDPPYNTGRALQSYEDGLEHSTWLSLIRERLEILWRL